MQAGRKGGRVRREERGFAWGRRGRRTYPIMFQGPKVHHIRRMVGGIAAGFMFACRLVVGSFEVFCVVVSVGCLGGWHSAFWRLRVQSCSVEEVLYSIG